jgi:hypothetical protein
MKSGIFDKNKIEVKIGDTIILPYITPLGEISDEDGEKVEVVFKYGCYGFFTKTQFIPLIDLQCKKVGEYVPNHGNKTVYTEEYYFTIDKSSKTE